MIRDRITDMARDLKGMTRSAAIGTMRRRAVDCGQLIDRLQTNPDGSPSDFAAAVDALEAYGEWLCKFAKIVRDIPEDPPVKVPLTRGGSSTPASRWPRRG